MQNINPNFKKHKTAKDPSAEELLKPLKTGNRAALSKSLTMVESKKEEHRLIAEKLIHLALPFSGNSVRVGITGVPGVGKSTFIEAFGNYLTEQGKKVAVLAIDPSSNKNRGSILGDKTRMYELSQNENAFIRPSPSAGSLGGVARKTRESIILCEAAGFDIILIETVGVGQSETAVKSMVDFFMLLMLAGAGDELQGIKRGIMEMADLLVVNKADGDNAHKAKRAAAEYKRALHLFPPNSNAWTPRVQTCSATEKTGIEESWKVISEFENQQKTKGYFEETRKQQAIDWFEESIGELLLSQFRKDKKAQINFQSLRTQVQEGKKEAYSAAQEAVRFLFE